MCGKRTYQTHHIEGIKIVYPKTERFFQCQLMIDNHHATLMTDWLDVHMHTTIYQKQ